MGEEIILFTLLNGEMRETITTGHTPKVVLIKNRQDKEKMKPEEICKYNDSTSGVDRCDQLVS